MLCSWVWLATWSEEKKKKNYERMHVTLEKKGRWILVELLYIYNYGGIGGGTRREV